MGERPRQRALIARRIGRRGEAGDPIAPRIHALAVHRVVWQRPYRGGVLPADRRRDGSGVIRPAGRLRQRDGGRGKRCPNDSEAGRPRDSCHEFHAANSGITSRAKVLGAERNHRQRSPAHIRRRTPAIHSASGTLLEPKPSAGGKCRRVLVLRSKHKMPASRRGRTRSGHPRFGDPFVSFFPWDVSFVPWLRRCCL